MEAAFRTVQMRYQIEQGRRDSSDKCPSIYNGERGRTYVQSVEKLKAMRRNTTKLLRNLTTILYRRRMLFMSEHVFIAAFKKKEKQQRPLFEISTNWQNIANLEHKFKETSEYERELSSEF